MTDKDGVEQHPIQTHRVNQRRSGSGRAPTAVTLRAYEVYVEVYGPQRALIEGSCRGGFGIGELIAFLYARSFPKTEWRQRCEEALRGLEL
jgi:hypothetical protein